MQQYESITQNSETVATQGLEVITTQQFELAFTPASETSVTHVNWGKEEESTEETTSRYMGNVESLANVDPVMEVTVLF